MVKIKIPLGYKISISFNPGKFVSVFSSVLFAFFCQDGIFFSRFLSVYFEFFFLIASVQSLASATAQNGKNQY
jgi:hypothetical protein